MSKIIVLVDVDLTLIVSTYYGVYYNHEVETELQHLSANPDVDIYLFTAFTLANIWELANAGENSILALRSNVYERLSTKGIRIAGIITIGSPLFDAAPDRCLGEFGNIVMRFERAAVDLVNKKLHEITHHPLTHCKKTYSVPTLRLGGELSLLPMVKQELEYWDKVSTYYFKGEMLMHVLEKLSLSRKIGACDNDSTRQNAAKNEVKHVLILDDRHEMTTTVQALKDKRLGVYLEESVTVTHVFVQPPRCVRYVDQNVYDSSFPPSNLAKKLAEITSPCPKENDDVPLGIRRTKHMLNLADAVAEQDALNNFMRKREELLESGRPIVSLQNAITDRQQKLSAASADDVVSEIMEQVLQTAMLKM